MANIIELAIAKNLNVIDIDVSDSDITNTPYVHIILLSNIGYI